MLPARGCEEDEFAAAVFLPRALVVTGIGRFVFAVADDIHDVGPETVGGEPLTDRQRAAIAEGAIVFLRATFIAMAFDEQRIAGHAFHPANDFFQLGNFTRTNRRFIEVEINRLIRKLAAVWIPTIMAFSQRQSALVNPCGNRGETSGGKAIISRWQRIANTDRFGRRIVRDRRIVTKQRRWLLGLLVAS